MTTRSRHPKLFSLLLAACLAVSITLPGWSKKEPPATDEKPAAKASKPTPKAAIKTAKNAPKAGDIQALWLVAQTQLLERNYPEAIAAFKKILAQNPHHSQSLNGLALAQYFHSNYAEALTTATEGQRLDPLLPTLYLTKARILDALGRKPEAVDYYLTFAVLAPADAMVLDAQRRADDLLSQLDATLMQPDREYFSGLRALSLGDTQRALPLLEAFGKTQPGNANVAMLVGLAYSQQNKWEKAAKQFERLTESQPQSPVGYYRLGETYQKLGKAENARAAWEKFVEIAPHSAMAADVEKRLQHPQP